MPACIETSHKNKEQTVSHLFHEPLFLKHMLKPAVGGNKTTEKIRSQSHLDYNCPEFLIQSQCGGGSNQACAETAEGDAAARASRFNLPVLRERGASHEC